METLTAGQKLVVASHNQGKVREIRELVAPFGLDVVSAGELDLPEPEETKDSFIGNARLKAVAAAKASGLPALSDDSGLEVHALGGEPGIYSARWAGPDKDFSMAMSKVNEALIKAGAKDARARSANFVCALCLAWPSGKTSVFEGKVFGTLVWPPRGQNGFGYDAMFQPDGHDITFGEMDPAAKHAMSHRAKAFKKFVVNCLQYADKDAMMRFEQDETALMEALDAIASRDDLAKFVMLLQRYHENHSQYWENPKMPDYLNAMSAWLKSWPSHPEQPDWRHFGNILYAATLYE